MVGKIEILFLALAGNILIPTASRLALGLTQHFVQWVRLAVLLVVKRSQHETVSHLH
jgi:hypothetical protein